jgi:hypothetical protein
MVTATFGRSCSYLKPGGLTKNSGESTHQWTILSAWLRSPTIWRTSPQCMWLGLGRLTCGSRLAATFCAWAARVGQPESFGPTRGFVFSLFFPVFLFSTFEFKFKYSLILRFSNQTQQFKNSAWDAQICFIYCVLINSNIMVYIC